MKQKNKKKITSIIYRNEIHQRIDNFLFATFKKVPKSMIYRLIRKGKIIVNRKKILPKYKLNKFDEIILPLIKEINVKQINNIIDLKKAKLLKECILYEDSHILIINKPSGLAVHGGSGINFGLIENLRLLKPNLKFLELIHRLDKDTSGVLLIAKKRISLLFLHEQFRLQKIKKDYLALVYGRWNKKTKLVQVPLLKRCHFKNWTVQVNKNGKNSKTFFKVEEQFSFTTLVRAYPVTGRTHQVRVHMKYLGYPIILDKKYGDPIINEKLKKIGINRLFLHASSIKFKHPINNKFLKIKAPLDNKFKRILNSLREGKMRIL